MDDIRRDVPIILHGFELNITLLHCCRGSIIIMPNSYGWSTTKPTDTKSIGR